MTPFMTGNVRDTIIHTSVFYSHIHT